MITTSRNVIGASSLLREWVLSGLAQQFMIGLPELDSPAVQQKQHDDEEQENFHRGLLSNSRCQCVSVWFAENKTSHL